MVAKFKKWGKKTVDSCFGGLTCNLSHLSRKSHLGQMEIFCYNKIYVLPIAFPPCECTSVLVNESTLIYRVPKREIHCKKKIILLVSEKIVYSGSNMVIYSQKIVFLSRKVFKECSIHVAKDFFCSASANFFCSAFFSEKIITYDVSSI